MKLKHCLWTLVLAAIAVALFNCGRQIEQPPQISDAPLLLLEDTQAADDLLPATGPTADNSRCHVCHINYAEEELAVIHQRANISCEQCHGACDAHCSDEDNVTPPDIIYPLAKVNPFCVGCHPRDKINTPQHKLLLAGTATENTYCTDCHGKHRLAYRTRKWDKTTRQLIQDDKVRMTTDEMLKRK